MQRNNLLISSSLRSMMIERQPYRASPIELLPELLHRLKCNNCSGYISCPPVYETESGSNICGRCPTPEGSATRSKLYEILAEMISFPCKFSMYGCLNVIPFLDQKEHDEVCEFKPVACLIATDGSCEWKGPKGQLYNHCDNSHVSRILHNNSSAIQINVGKSMFNAYIMQALGKLYLVHIKVCLVSKKIYHSMRYLEKNRQDCLYGVDIYKNSNKISRMREVLPVQDLQFNENNCMAVSLNSLIDVFGSFDEICSKVSIYNKCAECHNHFKKLVYHADFGWICMECVPPVPIALINHMCKPISKKELTAKQKQLSRK